jgi:hypothetical protein
MPQPEPTPVSAKFGPLRRAGCGLHPERLDLSCGKIRKADGTALTDDEIWEALCELPTTQTPEPCHHSEA